MTALLSPKEMAQAIGVSESTLKRWADDGLIHVSRTAGGHRRIRLAEAIRFIRDSRVPVIEPEYLGLPALSAALSDPRLADAPDQALYQALQEGDAAQARSLALAYYISGQSLAQIFDGPMRSALVRLGELWKHGDYGILIEHRATDACIQIVGLLRAMLKPAAADAPVAVGAAPPGDPYLLPCMMAATVLADAGYREVNLGPETPLEILLQAAQQHEAALVWLALSTARPAVTAQEVGCLVERLLARRTPLVLGGRGVDEIPAPDRPNVHILPSMGDLGRLARGLRG